MCTLMNNCEPDPIESFPLQETAGELQSLMGAVIKAARRDTERRLAEAGVEISGLQYGILRILCGQSHTLSELSRLMARESVTLLPAVDALEKKGLVSRGQDPHDRRRTPLGITTEGRRLLECVPQVGEHDRLPAALHQIGPARVGQLVVLLREIAAQLSEDKVPVSHPNQKEN